MKVFLFDFDGVILDSFQNTVHVFCETLEKYCGKSFSEQDISEMCKISINKTIVNLLPDEKIRAQFKKEAFSLLKIDLLDVFEGMVDLLNELESLGELIIITSNKPLLVKNYLINHNILPHLEVLGSNDTVSKTDKINIVKERFANASFVYVGDTVGDVKEAKAADVTSIAVTWGYHSKEVLEVENPDYLVDTVDELRTILLKN